MKPSLKDILGAVRWEITGYPALLERRARQVGYWGKIAGKTHKSDDS